MLPAVAAVYSVPSPLPSAKPGAIIWSRPFDGGSALRNAASNTLVLYHTISATGQGVAVSGVVSVPKGSPPAGGWPIVSWAHGTTGNAPQCAPSNGTSQNVEQRFLDGLLAQGFAIAQTDYEGEATPGIHPYFAGTPGAHDVIDIVRAARQLNSEIGVRWFAAGHSEGGAVVIFTSALAQAWAPELHLLGAIAYAPGSDIPDLLGQTSLRSEPTPTLPLLAMMVEGIASTDPAVDLNAILSPEGMQMLPQLQQQCAGALMRSQQWTTMPPARFFRPGVNSSRLMQDFIANEPSQVRPTAPLLIEQGTSDELVPYGNTMSLRTSLCSNGARPQLQLVQGATHDGIMARSVSDAVQWMRDRLAGKPDTPNCIT